MSRLGEAFKENKALIGFLKAGDPNAEKTIEFAAAMAEGGCDVIEIGIPFSDPTAEAPVIQQSNLRALKLGLTTDDIFGLAREIKEKTGKATVLMTYMNPMFHYGYDAFFKQCAAAGIDGVMSPELPFDESDEVRPFAEKYDVDLISAVAPASEERIKEKAPLTAGFAYVVPPMTDGGNEDLVKDPAKIAELVRGVTDTPTAIEVFGSGAAAVTQAARGADGVILATAMVELIERYGDEAAPRIEKLARELKSAITGL